MTIMTEDFNLLDGSAPDPDDIGYVTFTVDEMRFSASGSATIVPVKVTVHLVAGVMTTPELDPGPAVVRIGSAGRNYSISIPASGTHRLWPLIQSAVQLPPMTSEQRIASAVAAYLVANPPTGGGGESGTVDTLGGTGAVGRDVMKSATQASARSILNAASPTDVAAQIAALVNASPAALDTLQELATALGNDPNFATTVAGQIGAKYTKPAGGIPKADLITTVQTSLGKADASRTAQQVSDAIAAALVGYVQLPSGGTDGQVLTKAGTGLVWATVGGGGAPVTDGALAQASATYKTAAKAAGTSRLKILSLCDSTGDGYGKPGGPDTWAKTWPLKLAALLRAQLGVAAGGRGWVGPSTPLAPGNYVWTPPAVSGGNGTSRDDLSTQVGIPGALWLQKGHATNVDTVTYTLPAGVTAVDVVTTGYGGNMVFTAANAGSSVTKDSTGDRVVTRITNPGATLSVTGASGVGFAMLGVIEYIGDAAVGVTQWNLSRGAMRAFEYADWLTDGAGSLKPMIDVYDPHVALVCLGANDYPDRTTAQFGTALTTIFNQIRAVSATTEVVFIIRPLADSGSTSWNTYNATLQSTAASLGARVLDARGLSGSGLYLADGVHFTEAGNTAMANLVLEFMKVAA